jgi:pimeloyl-[acyl-carrier protein] methyl ester esterase
MSPVSLLFIHGWGFDATFWRALRDALPDYSTEALDLGYFGAPSSPRPRPPVLVVAHSLGAMLALREPPDGCTGIVAINGFDRFAERPGTAGVPLRVIDRMIAKFGRDPAAVVADFRKRCGSEAPFPSPDESRLAEHLSLLRDGDERARSAAWHLPLLALHGTQDPLLPQELRDDVFAGAARVQRASNPEARHLLPLSHPAWCAQHIRTLLGSGA